MKVQMKAKMKVEMKVKMKLNFHLILYVKKIENISENFIFGMYISSLIDEEECGLKYFDFDNKDKDLCEIISNVGINYVRVRIWNNPYDLSGKGYGGGNSDMDKAILIGKRVTKYGMKLMASFHFSDFYADPAIQKLPKAWAGFNLDQKIEAAIIYSKV